MYEPSESLDHETNYIGKISSCLLPDVSKVSLGSVFAPDSGGM